MSLEKKVQVKTKRQSYGSYTSENEQDLDDRDLGDLYGDKRRSRIQSSRSTKSRASSGRESVGSEEGVGEINALFNFIHPLLDDHGVSEVLYDDHGTMLDDQPSAPHNPEHVEYVSLKRKIKAMKDWRAARQKMDMKELESELGENLYDGGSKFTIPLKELTALSERVAKKFGYDIKDALLKDGTQTENVEEVDGFRITKVSGMYHSVDISTHLEFPFVDSRVQKADVEDEEMPWPPHTYPKIFADTTEEDFTAKRAPIENNRQLARVLISEPWTPEYRRKKLSQFLQAKIILRNPDLKMNGVHGLWELALNPEHHPDIPLDTIRTVVHQLRAKNVELSILAVQAVWALSTSVGPRRALVEMDTVEILYKLLNATVAVKITTAAEAAEQAAKAAEKARIQAEKDAAAGLSGLGPPPGPPPPAAPVEEEVVEKAAMNEDERDRLQRAVMGALNMMMVDKVCRERVLPVDQGISMIIKLCRRMRGYSDDYQRERRMVAGMLLSNLVTRDMNIRFSILPDAVTKLLSLLNETGPGATEVCHYVSAALQVYVLDDDSMEVVDEDNGVVRMFNQCLDSLHGFVGRLENIQEETVMTPEGLITICERMSLSMWGAAKQQADGDKADVPFEKLASLCNLVQRFIALQLLPNMEDLEMWRVGHNLAAALTSFAIREKSCQHLMGVAESVKEELLDPNSACSVLMVFASPRFLEGFVRASALTGLAFLASHSIGHEGEQSLIGVYRKRMLATGTFPTVLASMSAITDKSSDQVLKRCGSVTLMYLATQATEVGTGVSSWELFQLLALMVDSQDIEMVEPLMVVLWALMRDHYTRWMVREAIPQNQVDFTYHLVRRVSQECITAADIRALFIQNAERKMMRWQRTESRQSLWETTLKHEMDRPPNSLGALGRTMTQVAGAKGSRPGSANLAHAAAEEMRADQEACGTLGSQEENQQAMESLSNSGSRPQSAKTNDPKSPKKGSKPASPKSKTGSPKSKTGSKAGSRAGSFKGSSRAPSDPGAFDNGKEAIVHDLDDHTAHLEVEFQEAVFVGNFERKDPRRFPNPHQTICLDEHPTDKWWGIKQLFRIWETWKDCVMRAGHPSEQVQWRPVLKYNEFLVACFWMYLVSDDIEIPARRSHLSLKDRITDVDREFWWMMEVQNHIVDLEKYPMLVRVLEILFWTVSLPEERHWVARQLSIGALWNMAVRRPAVELKLVQMGIVEVLLQLVNEINPETEQPKWPPSLRDSAAMFLGTLMTEYCVVESPHVQGSVGIQRIQSAMLILLQTGVRRLQACALRVLGRMTYIAPLGHPHPFQFLKESKMYLGDNNCISIVTVILKENLRDILQAINDSIQFQAGSPKGRKGSIAVDGVLDSQWVPKTENTMELDSPGENEIGTIAMLAHCLRLLRNMSLVTELQIPMAKTSLLTLMKISNTMAECLEGVNEPTELQHDVVNHCSATMYNLASNPDNRTRFYKLELAESRNSEVGQMLERLANPKQTQSTMGPPPLEKPKIPRPANSSGKAGKKAVTLRGVSVHSAKSATAQSPKHPRSPNAAARAIEEGELLDDDDEDFDKQSASQGGQTPRSSFHQSSMSDGGSCLSFTVNRGRAVYSHRQPARLQGALGEAQGKLKARKGRPTTGGWYETHIGPDELDGVRESPWAPLIRTIEHKVEPPARPATVSASRPLKIAPRSLSTPADSRRPNKSAQTSTGPMTPKYLADPEVSFSSPEKMPRDSGRTEGTNEEGEEDNEDWGHASYKEAFLEWEQHTFYQGDAMKAIRRVTGSSKLSNHVVNMSAPKYDSQAGLPPRMRNPGMWGIVTTAGVDRCMVGPSTYDTVEAAAPALLPPPDGLALPELHATLKRPLRHLWKASDDEAEFSMGNNRWAPVITEYTSNKPPEPEDKWQLPAVAQSLLNTPYPKIANYRLAEAKDYVETNRKELVHHDVRMQRPPSAKMLGGRKPRTILKLPQPDMQEGEDGQMVQGEDPKEFTLGVNLAPRRARNHIVFTERPKHLDPRKDRRPKLTLFEHHQGSRVYDGLFPDYQLPNGKKAFFYYECKMVEEVEVSLRNPPDPPMTLKQALQRTIPLHVDLYKNTKLPGVAPPISLLKPVPKSPPLPSKHTLEVVDPSDLTTWRAFGNLIQRPLTIRVVAKQKSTLIQKETKESLKPPTPPPEKKRWKIEQSVFKLRGKESEGRTFVHSAKMATKMINLDWDRLYAKEKFIATMLREWGESPMSNEEKLLKLKAAMSKHYNAVVTFFDYFANLGSNNPYQMGLNAFSSCLEECQIPDGESLYCKKSDCDTLFIVARTGSTQKGSKLDKLKDDNCLLRFEFFEVLMRIAVAKIGKITGADPADSFDQLMEEVVLKNLPAAAKVDRDVFRMERLYNEECDDMFTENLYLLKTIYSAYRCRPSNGGLRTKNLSMPGFLDIMDRAAMYDEIFTLQEARLCFLWSRMHTADESVDYLKYTALTFTDFMECIGRVADLKMIATDEELKSHGFSSRFEWMMSVENGEVNIPRRPSAMGSGSHSTRPLHEKVKGLLEMMYERLYYNPQNIKPFSKDTLRKMMIKQDKERGD